MDKDRVIGIVLALSLILLLVVLDYNFMGGVYKTPEFVLREVQIKAVSSKDGAPVIGARVRCFQDENRNACSQRESGKLGVISLMVPGTKMNIRTNFFRKEPEYVATEDPNIQIMLIHLDYQNQVQTINVEEVLEGRIELIEVSMEPKWEEGETDSEDVTEDENI